MTDTTITILPADKPYLPLCRCSRCGGKLEGSVASAMWNGIEFSYCGECRFALEHPQARAKQ